MDMCACAQSQSNASVLNTDKKTLPWCMELFFPSPGCICLLFQLEEVRVPQM